MPIYEYRGITREGKPVRGLLDADGFSGARDRLKGQGIYLQELRGTGGGRGKKGLSLAFLKRRSVLTSVTRQLSFLLGAAIPVDSAFEGVIDQAEDGDVKQMLVDIKEKIKEGKTVSQALSQYPEYFNAMYVSTVHAGEVSGKLDLVFDRLAKMHERSQSLVSKLRSSLTYPSLMLFFAILVVVFLISFIVPTFSKLFAEFGGVLPLPTRILIGVSNLFSSGWWAILIALGAAAVTLRRVYRSERGKRSFDSLVLRLPVIGRIVLDTFKIRFSYTLGLMLANGVGILEALENTRGVFSNIIFKNLIDGAIDRMKKGEKLSRALSHEAQLSSRGSGRPTHVFGSSFLGMINAGEAGDRLPDVLERIATSTEVDIEERVKTLTSLVEPVVILIIGLFVGFVVLSIMLPIFQVNQIFG
jgi:general secretion pathway protein F